MLIQGSIGSDKTDFLIDKYIDLINDNVNPEQILVLLLNSYKKAEFLKKICFLNIDKPNVYTFQGLCYNAFFDNWKFILKFIPDDNKIEYPNLCGLEISQYIFKESIKTADFSDYISKINLLHQLFRRYSLIVQNCLSNEDVVKRSKILKESFYKEAQTAIDNYKNKTFQYKSFDYLRQLAVLPLIYNNTDYFKNIKYLIVDDADEFSYAFWLFIYNILPNLSDYFIAFDNKGSSRCGYLCSYRNGFIDFINKYSPKIIKSNEKAKFKILSDKFYDCIKAGQKIKTPELSSFSEVKRLDMLQKVNTKIKNLIKNGIKDEEISVITPILDEILFESFNSENIKFQTLSGNEKLSDDNSVKLIIIILKLFNNLKISGYELKNILIKLLKIPFEKCYELLDIYKKDQILIDYDFKNEKFNYAYTKFLSLIKIQNRIKNNISEQIKIIYENLVQKFKISISKDKYNFLLKEAKSFEFAFLNNIQNPAQEFTIQIQNSIISENSADAIKIKKGKIIVSTPQKIIDYAYKTKYQLWIDISSSDWIKNDTGTLYNAWVLSKDWTKSQFTLEDNIELTNDKTARIIRKLMLCSENKIFLFSSLYDNNGNENFGGISDFINTEQETKSNFKIIPRPDQKTVLEYKNGQLGIMAVPGAGKTTILLALILKMLQNGIKSSNIFVLTYMESASKNFKEKIKSALPQNYELPNISTIHGLSLRIIKENANYTTVGLDENFEICDDNTKENIIRGLFFNLKIDEEKYDIYLKCISDVKLSCSKKELYSEYKEIQDFYNFYNEYNSYLKQNNLLDYDDMLCYALKILEENVEIRKYYQNLCRYIIEDEAQDSTDIQQKLIKILSSKYNNLVRCGDINQAITSTFTNSNPNGFKNFINKNKKIEMNSSQRCSRPIYTLANKFIKNSLDLTDAFYDIQIKGTENNPQNNKIPEYIIFDSEKEEKDFIVNKIKQIKSQTPDASVAILVRMNLQVNEYNELFLSNDIKTSIRSDCLNQKSIYKIIYAILSIIQNPMNNDNILNFASLCKQKKIYNLKQTELDYIKLLKTPFIMINPDELGTEALLQLYFDIIYHLNNSTTSMDILALETGIYYSQNAADKSNSYMISTLIKRLMLNCNNEEELLIKLEYASQKNSGTYKFFDDFENIENTVNIMTMHKSKGDEFDYVFIPELNEDNYSTIMKNIKLKTGNHFIQTIKNQTEKIKIKSNEELKQEQINETLRLLYVGITRAKQELYFTNANNYKKRKNTKPVEILKKLAAISE